MVMRIHLAQVGYPHSGTQKRPILDCALMSSSNGVSNGWLAGDKRCGGCSVGFLRML